MGFKARVEVLLASSGFLIVAGLLGSPVANGPLESQLSAAQVLSGLGCVACILAFLLCIDVYWLNPADSHTFRTLYAQYCYLLLLRIMAPYCKWNINRKLQDPKKESEKSLLNIIRRNQDSSYGKEYKFSEIKSREDFVRMHPLTRQEHYTSYVDRIAEGEHNVLSTDKTLALISTSGTTGPSKVFSITDYYTKKCKMLNAQIMGGLIHMINLQRYAHFHIFSKMKRSSGGLPIGALSQILSLFPAHNLIPEYYSRLLAEDSSYYAQAVFSLADRELHYIQGFSADLMYSYWKFITKHWDNLCEDINQGEIGHHVDMPEEIRLELSKHLKADPARAAELRAAREPGIVGLAKRVWPSFEFITMGKVAGFKMSADTLMKNHLKGVKVIDLFHAATEGLTGLNLNGDKAHIDSTFTLITFSSSFFTEFIPLHNVEKEQPKTVFAEELKLGEMYEVVHTNVNGLYRIRYGDIIKVTGFNKKTPKYELVFRLGQRLNIAYERTPDKFLTQALKQQEQFLPEHVHIVDFTTTESVTIENITGNMSKGHYVFFVEFNTNSPINETDLSEKIDKTLSEVYEQYKRFKDIDSIGDLELIQVQSGTFDGLKDFIWDENPHAQFKMPRVLRREPALRYLLDKALQSKV